MRSTGHRNSGQLSTALFGMAAAALAIVVIVTTSLRLANALRPRDGDILSFAPANGDIVATKATIVAIRVGRSPDASCVLDPKMMLQSGGSLVVEATEASGTRRYRVHWAGGRTSASDADCGRSADLLLNANDISVLWLVANAVRAEMTP